MPTTFDENKSNYPEPRRSADYRDGTTYPPEEDTISLLDLIAVLAKRKWLIIGTTFLAAVGIVIYSIITIVLPSEISPLPNVYTATAEVVIGGDSSTNLQSVLANSNLGGLAGLAGISGSGGSSNGALALALLESRSVLDHLVDEFTVIEVPEGEEPPPRSTQRNAYVGMSEFNLDAGTGILSISVTNTDPELAAQIANRFVELLDKRFQELGIDQTQSKVQLTEEKMEEVNREIDRLQTQIEDFQRTYGTFSVEMLIEEQSSIRARIRSDLVLKEIEISTYEDFSSINDPALQRLRTERDNLQQLLREMDQGYSDFTGSLPSQQELPALASRFARLEREAEVKQQIYSTLVQQYELAQLSLEGETRSFQILEYAEVPDRKSDPSRAMLSIITTITAFFLSVFAAFVLEYFSRVKEDPEEGEKLDAIKGYLSLRRKR